MEKRGLSAIVVTVLIILLALAAVVLIWVFIKPFIFSGVSQIDVGQFGTSFSIPAENVNVDTGANSVKYTAKRGAGDVEVVGMNWIIEDSEGDRCVTEQIFNVGVTFDALETVSSPDIPYGVADPEGDCKDVNNVAKVSVAPILKTEAGEVINTNVAATTVVSASSGGGGTCTPDCTGKVCGSDGCGGSCSPGCSVEESCVSGRCVPTSSCTDGDKQPCTESNKCKVYEDTCSGGAWGSNCVEIGNIANNVACGVAPSAGTCQDGSCFVNVALPNGLVSWWNFEDTVGSWDGTAGEVNDVQGSSTHNPGKAVADVNVISDATRAGTVASFDGSGDNIRIDDPVDGSLDFGTSET
ncbi:MAG: hypothetical protein QF535_01725, partial [Anaerolineales bacterium]|nr:hypothetical protein [Anaerolineales bacterium]